MEQPKAETNRALHNLPLYLLSDVGFAFCSARKKIIKLFSYLTTKRETKLNFFFHGLADKISGFWRYLAMLPPLRKIVRRELCEQEIRPKYIVYSLIDTLECGHTKDSYLFNGLRDLTNPYTDSPVVSAKRHRCRPCMSLLAKKKPVQSVPFASISKTA